VVRAAALMSLIVSPLGAGLAAVAPTIVATFFDDKWGPTMAPMLAILSTMAVFRPMTWSAIAYLQAVQQTRLIMYSSFFRAVGVLALVGGFGYAGGPSWACIGGAIGYAVHTVLTIIAAGRVADFAVGAYLIGVARPLLACVPMVLAVLAVEHGLSAAGVPRPVSLGGQVAAGAAVYVASLFVFVRSGVTELLRHGRDTLRRRRR
jgi:PST family polysaccharide transporter